MSEYQYYEFQAVDRSLTASEMAELRSWSSRARITPTSFVNDYEWGEFKGDEDAWMDKYFDAFLYFANWGTNVLKLRLPTCLLDRDTLDPYCTGESFGFREGNGKTTITFVSDVEDIDEWPDEADALSTLIPLRTDLARGDLRALYIGWLLCVQARELDDEEVEPPVPPGLRELNGSLERLVDFLRIDADLLDVAAETSPPMQVQTLTEDAIQKWIASLAPDLRDDYLRRFIAGEDHALTLELQKLIRPEEAFAGPTRTVGELLGATEKRSADRRKAQAEQAMKEKARRERDSAEARSRYLATLAEMGPGVWKQIEDLVATRQPASYDRVVELLVDLREVAQAQDSSQDFCGRLDRLQNEQARKPSLIARIRRAGFAAPQRELAEN